MTTCTLTSRTDKGPRGIESSTRRSMLSLQSKSRGRAGVDGQRRVLYGRRAFASDVVVKFSTRTRLFNSDGDKTNVPSTTASEVRRRAKRQWPHWSKARWQRSQKIATVQSLEGRLLWIDMSNVVASKGRRRGNLPWSACPLTFAVLPARMTRAADATPPQKVHEMRIIAGTEQTCQTKGWKRKRLYDSYSLKMILDFLKDSQTRCAK